MISADDHENMALSDMQRDDNQAALVSAVLALASAVNRLADAGRFSRHRDRRPDPASTQT